MLLKSIEEIKQQITAQRIVPLFYHSNKEVCISVAKALYNAGIRFIEFTNRGDKARENFKVLVEAKQKMFPDLLISIGTIKTPEDALYYSSNGADALISPVFDLEIHEAIKEKKILWIPGCMTVTEIHAAQKVGYTCIKLFPGNVLTQGFVQAIKPLFPHIDFIVTGGVETSKENIKSWLSTGLCAVGIGSKLITNDLLENKNYTLLETETKNILSYCDK
jgi:2-dehydro-3-deoxyphosphogluconate aldolase / (4S)-4-hydroxy-2-oxoglutarate aldolase